MRTKTNDAPQPLNRELVEKYNLRGPRYTSYPTAPEWTERVGSREYWKHINQTNKNGSNFPLSLYIHIPFCSERCYYCACNVIITQREDVADHYVDLVSKEADLIAPKLPPERRVIQFHLGGGTPTHLSPSSLRRLLEKMDSHFTFTSDAERSVEVDLRVTTEDHLKVLREHEFNRISTGVQDFFHQTQLAIHRVQSIEETHKFLSLCREYGFKSINIDLVYGLPYQTAHTFDRTLDTIFEVDPDRIALYNYAYLPAKLPYQRRIEESTLPNADERFTIFNLAVERFAEYGWVYIGMDHFAKSDDELTLAQKEGTLQRNFMGFTTRAGTDLYAFGVSSITSLPSLYVQNTKNLRRYEDALNNGDLPVERGVELTQDDRIRRWVIMELMCNLRVSVVRFKYVWGEDFHHYFAEELPQLQPFIDDGLVNADISREIRVTELGRIIVRPVAMIFDRYLAEARKKGKSTPVFSRTV
jgi:oxygen-independent coproporphyrinogen-3 oxidase